FISALGLLEGVANNKEMLKRYFYLMNRRTIDLYAKGGPFAYVVPVDQRDPIAAAKLVQLVQAEGGEVHVAQAPFTADGREYPAGTHVMLLAQPFGRWIKDLLEAQRYPDIRWPFATAPIDRPYDVSAWTLGMLMGVKTVKVDKPFEARLTLLTADATARAGKINGSGSVYVFNHEVNNSLVAMNRLLKDGADVAWARDAVTVNGHRFSPGAIVVRGARREAIAKIAEELKLDVEAAGTAPSATLAIRAPRLALYEPWGGNMDAGWTRWLLEQHEFPYTHARNADLRKPDLISRFDVILFAEMSAQQVVRGQIARNVRPEYKGGIGEEGVRNLKDFVQAGGTVITLGNAAAFAIEQLGVPAENVVAGVDADTFFCPGSLLKVNVDTRHPIGFGMPDEADAMFISNGGYVTKPSFASISAGIVARYPQEPLLRSGWIIGDERLRGTAAVLDVGMGRGRVIMHTFRVQSRAQTWGTYKLLFNSIFYGPAAGARGTVETSAAAAAR
ncbi:MAG: hypothetical protein ACRD09_10545, partial [Vicinamibacterales bacterium]